MEAGNSLEQPIAKWFNLTDKVSIFTFFSEMIKTQLSIRIELEAIIINKAIRYLTYVVMMHFKIPRAKTNRTCSGQCGELGCAIKGIT